ncbi:nucleotidyltransferase domain-containing protein [Spongiimicrobium salis]|uniref:nucleotidyltransferase domain-containing protein n=1 Tax=Spongiimicrobium salis TaxID=1667022 RepID=UPI00374DF8C5
MDLIKTFLYFAIFKHPLTKEEAKNFCQYKTDNIDADLALLVEKEFLYKFGEYYLPYNHDSWIKRRIKGNQLAEKKMDKANRMSRILSQFPFVRSVMISGSLAKGYMDKTSDIDFFVIMKSGNIAISKAMIGLFRRFFASKSLCVNYMISEDNLHIKKQNIYTAVEMATLIPTIDSGLFEPFMEENMEWVRTFLPNAVIEQNSISPMKSGKLKQFSEFILSTKLADTIDDKLRKIYLKRSGLQLGANKIKKNEEQVINKGILKLHNKSYQSRIMDMYEQYEQNFDSGEELVFNRHFYD